MMALRKLHMLAGVLLLITCLLAVGTIPPHAVYAAEISESEAPLAGSLCLNTATAAELMTLPQLGETIATRIIDYRERHHGFDSIDELLLIKGIGQSGLALWRPFLSLGIWRESDD